MSYRYPYGNTEQMNLDWFLNQWEKFKADWAEAEAGIDGSLDAEIAKVEAAMSELYAARDAAAASASAARQSSLDAAAAQVAAGNSKTAAQAAETSARGSQQAAAQSAQEAQTSAQGAENSALTASQAANTATQQAAGADAAKGAAEAAQQAAEDAQAAAAQSAGQAGQAATAAADHADDASDSATLAQQAAQDISDSVEQITTNKNDISDLKESTNDFQDAISEYKTPVNLFNKNSNLIRNGYKFSANGNYTALNGSSVSHPIKIKPNTTYCYKLYISYYGGDANSIVRRCDANGNLILTSPQNKRSTNVNNSYGYFYFTEDELQTWEYFCVMFRTSGLNDMIIAEGDTLPAYSEWFEPYYQIKESALPDSLPIPVNMQANPLYGKKAAFTGDSICYGAGAAGGYAKIIGENNNMTIFNSGRTGATLATGTTTDGVNRGWICNMVGSMPTDYDYYIVEGGVNDAALELGVQLGSMSNDYNATLDTSTLYGAMETICKTLQTTFLGKKYGFIFPHNCYGQAGRWNTEFRPAMKECLKKWGIPYLDLSEKTAELNNVSALRIYTSNSDGWHPTEEGYRLFYVDKIEAWMKTL